MNDATDIAPGAYCDALVIANDAPKSIFPISVIEMHLFSYLGCVLALFRGKPISVWGYQYAVTSEGFPFSAQFEEARKSLVLAGLIESDEDGFLKPRQPDLCRELNTILGLGYWAAERRPWLRTATECALALPMGSIRFAINQTPGLAMPIKLGQASKLLDTDDVSLLYDEYKIVSSVLGPDAEDTLSPAVLWLSARLLRKEDVEVGV
jgi:hypothetical protein